MLNATPTSVFHNRKPKHWYIIVQQIKQSTINYIHNTDGEG